MILGSLNSTFLPSHQTITNSLQIAQPAITRSKLTIETLQQSVKYDQN